MAKPVKTYPANITINGECKMAKKKSTPTQKLKEAEEYIEKLQTSRTEGMNKIDELTADLDAEIKAKESIADLYDKHKFKLNKDLIKAELQIEKLGRELSEERSQKLVDELTIAYVEEKTGKEFQRPQIILGALIAAENSENGASS